MALRKNVQRRRAARAKKLGISAGEATRRARTARRSAPKPAPRAAKRKAAPKPRAAVNQSRPRQTLANQSIPQQSFARKPTTARGKIRSAARKISATRGRRTIKRLASRVRRKSSGQRRRV